MKDSHREKSKPRRQQKQEKENIIENVLMTRAYDIYLIDCTKVKGDQFKLHGGTHINDTNDN